MFHHVPSKPPFASWQMIQCMALLGSSLRRLHAGRSSWPRHVGGVGGRGERAAAGAVQGQPRSRGLLALLPRGRGSAPQVVWYVRGLSWRGTGERGGELNHFWKKGRERRCPSRAESIKGRKGVQNHSNPTELVESAGCRSAGRSGRTEGH